MNHPVTSRAWKITFNTPSGEYTRHYVASMFDVLWHEFVDDCFNDIDERQYYDAIDHLARVGKAELWEIESELLTRFLESQVDDTPERRAKRLLFVEQMKINQVLSALDGEL